jgi:transcription initiation factor IIE alpha subunit
MQRINPKVEQLKPKKLTRNERRTLLKASKKEIGFECLSCHTIYDQGFMVKTQYRCPRCGGICQRRRLDKIKHKLEEKRLK